MSVLMFNQNRPQQAVRIQGIEKEAVKALGGMQKGKAKIKLFGTDVLPQLFDSHDWEGNLIAPKSLPAVVVWGMLPRVSGDTETMIPATLRVVGVNPARYLAPKFSGSAMVYLTLRDPARKDFTLGVITSDGTFIRSKTDGRNNPEYLAFFASEGSTSPKASPISCQAATLTGKNSQPAVGAAAVPVPESK